MGVYNLSPRALRNMREIATFLKARNPVAAARFLDEFLRHCQILADTPRGGWSHDELPGRKTRQWPGFKPYLIHYRRTRTGVYVVRIVDGRQDLRGLVRRKK